MFFFFFLLLLKLEFASLLGLVNTEGLPNQTLLPSPMDLPLICWLSQLGPGLLYLMWSFGDPGKAAGAGGCVMERPWHPPQEGRPGLAGSQPVFLEPSRDVLFCPVLGSPGAALPAASERPLLPGPLR